MSQWFLHSFHSSQFIRIAHVPTHSGLQQHHRIDSCAWNQILYKGISCRLTFITTSIPMHSARCVTYSSSRSSIFCTTRINYSMKELYRLFDTSLQKWISVTAPSHKIVTSVLNYSVNHPSGTHNYHIMVIVFWLEDALHHFSKLQHTKIDNLFSRLFQISQKNVFLKRFSKTFIFSTPLAKMVAFM